MNAYIFQAALLCADCAKTKQTTLDRIAAEHGNVNHDYRDDSDKYPQGPYGNGGGEADCPQYCDHCAMFLENPLTQDGMDYVRTAVLDANIGETNSDTAWVDIADKADDACHPVLAEWIRFYLANQ